MSSVFFLEFEYRGEIKIAQAACNLLAALSSPVQGVDIDHKIDVAHRNARTLLGAGQFGEVCSCLTDLFSYQTC
jgi:transcriptional regulator of aromatic amino acid metabolism